MLMSRSPNVVCVRVPRASPGLTIVLEGLTQDELNSPSKELLTACETLSTKEAH